MNNTIKKLLTDLENVNQASARERTKIETQLNAAYAKVLGNDKALEKALQNLEQSSEYGSDEGGIYHWYRYDGLDDVPAELRGYFENYVSDQGVTVDWDNSCLQAYEGGCIVINDDGDVLDTDSGKWIVSKKDYETEEQRNSLIEAHMERTGYFPGVFTEDRHGNVFPVKTN